VRKLLWALGGQFIEPIDDLGIATSLTNEAGYDIAAIPPTFLTSDAQHFGLAKEIVEYDCAVAGHGWKLAPKLAPNKKERSATEANAMGLSLRKVQIKSDVTARQATGRHDANRFTKPLLYH
jgi:hypothetical protein